MTNYSIENTSQNFLTEVHDYSKGKKQNEINDFNNVVLLKYSTLQQ